MADAQDRESLFAAQPHQFGGMRRGVIPRIVRSVLFHGAKVKGDVPDSGCEHRFLEQFEVLPPKKDFVVAGAEQGCVENVIIIQPEFRRLGRRHPARLPRTELSVPITGLFEVDVVVVNMTAFIQIVPTRISQDMNALVVRFARADKSLPLHQLIPEFAGKRPGQQVAPGPEALPQTWKQEAELLGRAINVVKPDGGGDRFKW